MNRIENETVLLPGIIADSVCQEAAAYLNSETVVGYSDRLIEKAETIYENNGRFRKRVKSAAGRDFLYCFMRHWLAGFLNKEHNHLFKKLPPSFANGEAIYKKFIPQG